MANIVKRVVKFGNSAHVILSKNLIGERVRIVPLSLDEMRIFDVQRLQFKLEKEATDLKQFHLSSSRYQRRLGPEYVKGVEARINSMENQLKEAQSLQISLEKKGGKRDF